MAMSVLPCSSSESTSEDSDDDNDGYLLSKKPRQSCQDEPMMQSSLLNHHDQIRGRRVNNIWGTVIQEAVLDTAMTHVGLERNERDVESYNYRAVHRDLTCSSSNNATHSSHLILPGGNSNIRGCGEDSLDACDQHSTDNNLDPSDIAINADVETDDKLWGSTNSLIDDDPFGPEACSVADIGRFETGKYTSSFDDSSTRHVRIGQKRRASTVRERLGKQRIRKLADNLCVKESDSVADVAQELARLLRETNSDLVQRAVQTLGTKRALEFYVATEEVQAKGGMLTQAGDRRRTSGGVFFTLIKEDNNVTGEQRDLIFQKSELERKLQKEIRSRRKARRRFPKQAPPITAHLPGSDDEEEKEEEEDKKGPFNCSVSRDDIEQACKLADQRRQELMQKQDHLAKLTCSGDSSLSCSNRAIVTGGGGGSVPTFDVVSATPHNTPVMLDKLEAEESSAMHLDCSDLEDGELSAD